MNSNQQFFSGWDRVIHGIAVIITMTWLGGVAFSVSLLAGFNTDRMESGMYCGIILLPLVLIVGSIFGIWKKISYRSLLIVNVLCGGFLLYLAWDDWSPPPAPKSVPVTAEDSVSYTAYRWLHKDGDPLSRLSEALPELPERPHFPNEQTEWKQFVLQHRANFESEWTEDILGREWVEVMAENPPEAMYPLEGLHSPIMDFKAIRHSCETRWGMTHLSILDGNSDEAARILLPLLRASYHLQKAAPTTVAEMIAVVMVRGTYFRLELALDSPTLSGEMRAEITTVLREAQPPRQIIENIFIGERFAALSIFDEIRITAGVQSTEPIHEITRKGLRFMWRFFFNRNRSERECDAFMSEASTLAQQRQLYHGTPKADALEKRVNRWSIKNPLGRMHISSSLKNYWKLVDTIWKAEDQRLVLLKRLTP